MKPKIYIAAPYTHPDPCINTYKAIETANKLMNYGYIPFVPHLTHFWHTMSPKPYETWMEYDQEWLQACQAMLRLPGKSSGAEREEQFAHQNQIPVYRSIEELLANMPPEVQHES